jgi:tRNA threonylcarbamoyladenosine biosynthesis protein TsaB
MLVLALDTTTRRGSAALVHGEALLDCEMGDAHLTHGERLPGDLVRLLDRNNIRLSEIELFAVATGPGSFTGLRIGIATMQGLALANGRGLIGVSALDALNAALRKRERELVYAGALMDAHRGEVYSALYCADERLDGPSVEAPAETLERWKGDVREPITLVGDGALANADLIAHAMPNASILPEVPPLAPAIAALAQQSAAGSLPMAPDAIRPLYVRRPDAELARDRARKS